jgi:hypothetical protein
MTPTLKSDVIILSKHAQTILLTMHFLIYIMWLSRPIKLNFPIVWLSRPIKLSFPVGCWSHVTAHYHITLHHSMSGTSDTSNHFCHAHQQSLINMAHNVEGRHCSIISIVRVRRRFCIRWYQMTSHLYCLSFYKWHSRSLPSRPWG